MEDEGHEGGGGGGSPGRRCCSAAQLQSTFHMVLQRLGGLILMQATLLQLAPISLGGGMGRHTPEGPTPRLSKCRAGSPPPNNRAQRAPPLRTKALASH
jgi:hypothetical protein